jgi:monolysocardiolipin acyltransferase
MRRKGCDRFQHIVFSRDAGRPLVTVSNHASTMDDPFLFCAILPWRFFATESTHRGVRWTLCANDICHQNKLLSDFFRAGKTLPIVRGGGAEQPILRLMAERLREHGDWLHVFPEGRVRQDGQMNKLKSGLAHVLCGVADAAPIVLPFHHRGMEEVLRVKTVVPHIGKNVHVIVGEPIEMADLLQRCRKVTCSACALTRHVVGRSSAPPQPACCALRGCWAICLRHCVMLH